ncbi:hypothetical protein [Olleya namhaensis]|uniref:hypothetical protein n=1 Tax=Olleya namhaensis TaxID=1144750 RepID=UPI0024908812|nr:hypothetical protein [Olleya namhaensis]
MTIHQLPAINNPEIFESLICDLFNEIETKNSYKKFGGNGHKQKGIDVFSSIDNIVIQCKKKDLSQRDNVIRKQLLNDIEKDVLKIIDENLKIKTKILYIASTYKNHPDLDEYCVELKEKYNLKFDIIYWGWNTIAEYALKQKTIIERYWKDFVITENSEEKKLVRNLELRKKITKDFSDWLDYSLDNRKVRNRMLLRAFDGKQYPKNEPDENGEYEWFKAEILRLYHNGIEFINMVRQIQVYENNTWEFVNENSEIKGKKINVYEIGKINFQDIVDYNIKGDEFYIYPHFFCKFKYKGTPFEKIYYQNVKKVYEIFEL